MSKELLDVASIAGIEVVHAQDVAAQVDEPITQMRAKKPGAASDQDSVHATVSHGSSP
jgi:hypothetical protein